MTKKKRAEYLKDKMSVNMLYFANNPHLSALIKVCLERFFADVDNSREPKAYIVHDTQKNIIESIRINTAYNKNLTLTYDLTEYLKAKEEADEAEEKRKAELQKITEQAKEYNASRFTTEDGKLTGSFSAAGAFLLKERE